MLMFDISKVGDLKQFEVFSSLVMLVFILYIAVTEFYGLVM